MRSRVEETVWFLFHMYITRDLTSRIEAEIFGEYVVKGRLMVWIGLRENDELYCHGTSSCPNTGMVL